MNGGRQSLTLLQWAIYITTLVITVFVSGMAVVANHLGKNNDMDRLVESMSVVSVVVASESADMLLRGQVDIDRLPRLKDVTGSIDIKLSAADGMILYEGESKRCGNPSVGGNGGGRVYSDGSVYCMYIPVVLGELGTVSLAAAKYESYLIGTANEEAEEEYVGAVVLVYASSERYEVRVILASLLVVIAAVVVGHILIRWMISGQFKQFLALVKENDAAGLAESMRTGRINVVEICQVARAILSSWALERRLYSGLVTADERQNGRVLEMVSAIHDELCPRLNHMKREAEAARAGDNRRYYDGLIERIDEVEKTARNIIRTGQSGTYSDLGFEYCMREMCEGSDADPRIRLVYRVEKTVSEDVGKNIERIVREAVSNSVQHSGAGVIVVSVTQEGDDSLHVAVRDDGCGVVGKYERSERFGMALMYERARNIGAELEIKDRDGGGSCVEVSVHIG